MSSDRVKASGVQELVDRLRQDGVAEGQEEAASLLEEARREASEIVDLAAPRSGRNQRGGPTSASTRLRAAGEEALDWPSATPSCGCGPRSRTVLPPNSAGCCPSGFRIPIFSRGFC